MSILMVGEMFTIFPYSKHQVLGWDSWTSQPSHGWNLWSPWKTGWTKTQAILGGRTSDGACHPMGVLGWLELQVSPRHCWNNEVIGLMDCRWRWEWAGRGTRHHVNRHGVRRRRWWWVNFFDQGDLRLKGMVTKVNKSHSKFGQVLAMVGVMSIKATKGTIMVFPQCLVPD